MFDVNKAAREKSISPNLDISIQACIDLAKYFNITTDKVLSVLLKNEIIDLDRAAILQKYIKNT